MLAVCYNYKTVAEVFGAMRLKYKNYIFDFDGTLVDSMPTFAAVMLRILDEYGISYGDDIIKIITPLGYAGTAKYFIGLGIKSTVFELVGKMNEYALFEYTNNIPAKDNVVKTLRELKRRGARLSVLTASPHLLLDPCLKRLGIYDLFENVWSCDDFNFTKADPEIYKAAAEKLGVSVSEVLFLDDNYNADLTAKAAGMRVCGVYDASSEEYADEIKSVSDHYIKDMSELLLL